MSSYASLFERRNVPRSLRTAFLSRALSTEKGIKKAAKGLLDPFSFSHTFTWPDVSVITQSATTLAQSLLIFMLVVVLTTDSSDQVTLSRFPWSHMCAYVVFIFHLHGFPH